MASAAHNVMHAVMTAHASGHSPKRIAPTTKLLCARCCRVRNMSQLCDSQRAEHQLEYLRAHLHIAAVIARRSGSGEGDRGLPPVLTSVSAVDLVRCVQFTVGLSSSVWHSRYIRAYSLVICPAACVVMFDGKSFVSSTRAVAWLAALACCKVVRGSFAPRRTRWFCRLVRTCHTVWHSVTRS